MDGKSLKNTVTDYDNAQQNFINCVSAFSDQRGEGTWSTNDGK